MRRPRSIAVSVAVLSALLLAAGGQALGSSTGTLRVTERHSHGGSMYIEGALEYLVVQRSGASRPSVRKSFGLGSVRLYKRLGAGTYRIESWTQPCDGNCDNLDPPTGRCRRTVRVRAGKTLHVTVVSAVGKPCRLVT